MCVQSTGYFLPYGNYVFSSVFLLPLSLNLVYFVPGSFTSLSRVPTTYVLFLY